MIETQYVIYTPDIMQYRVRPHPDHEDNEIILLEWKDADEKEWEGQVSFLKDDAIEIARCMIALAKGKAVGDV